MFCTLQNFIIFLYFVVGRDARVGPKTSDVDRAELPRLEGMSHSIVTIVTAGSAHPPRTGMLNACPCCTLNRPPHCKYPMLNQPAFFPLGLGCFCPSTRTCILRGRDSPCHMLSQGGLRRACFLDGFSCRATRTHLCRLILFQHMLVSS